MTDPALIRSFWTFERAAEFSYIDGSVRRGRVRQLCYAVIDAVIDIRETGEIRPGHVDIFARATACPIEQVSLCGGRWMAVAARYSSLAADRLRALATHPHWQVRFNVMCVADVMPRALAIDLLKSGLPDRKEKVALRAVRACDDCGGSEALALLESRLPREARKKVRENIEFCIELMRTPPVFEGRYEKRYVRGVVFSRDVGPPKKSGG